MTFFLMVGVVSSSILFMVPDVFSVYRQTFIWCMHCGISVVNENFTLWINDTSSIFSLIALYCLSVFILLLIDFKEIYRFLNHEKNKKIDRVVTYLLWWNKRPNTYFQRFFLTLIVFINQVGLIFWYLSISHQKVGKKSLPFIKVYIEEPS